MIISVERLKEFITTDISDQVLQARLEALEASIRQKTNNRFQDIRYRCCGKVTDGLLTVTKPWFDIGDTIMVNDDLRVIVDVSDEGMIAMDEPVLDQDYVLVTKVTYPKDVQLGVVDILKWHIENPADKAGISSETISRHSVSYQGSNEFDSDIGCPKRLLSFLNQYTKSRF